MADLPETLEAKCARLEREIETHKRERDEAAAAGKAALAAHAAELAALKAAHECALAEKRAAADIRPGWM